MTANEGSRKGGTGMKRHTKQLLACLLALAMLATNVDAVYAAPAGAAGENGGVQTVDLSEAAPEAGSGTIVRTAPEDVEDEADPADEETTDPAEDIDAEETEEVTETTVSDETTGTTGDEEAEELPVVMSSGMPERVGNPVTVVANSGEAGLNSAYQARAAQDPENESSKGTGRAAYGGECWEWSTVGLLNDNDGNEKTPMGGIVVTIYEAPANAAKGKGAAYIWLDNDEDGNAAYVDRERIYTDSFTKAAELIRNYEASGYLDGEVQDPDTENPDPEYAENNTIHPASGNEFAYKISLDASRQAAYGEGGLCTDTNGYVVAADEYRANQFYSSAADINAVSDKKVSLGGFDALARDSDEYALFDKIACIDLQGNELYIDSNGAPLRLSLPILSTDQPINEANGEPLYEWYGLGDVQYLCGGRLQIDVWEGTPSITIDGAVRVRQAGIYTAYDWMNGGVGSTIICRSNNTNKNGTFECQDFEYRGMKLDVQGVRFQAGAHDPMPVFDENGDPVDEDDDDEQDMDGSHVYLGKPDAEYAIDIPADPGNNGSIPNDGGIERTGAGNRVQKAEICFLEYDPNVEAPEATISDYETIACLFGNGVNIAPDVNIHADGLWLGHVNVRVEASYEGGGEIPTGELTRDRLPRILLTDSDYDRYGTRTLRVFGSVHSDEINGIPLLQVGLESLHSGEAAKLEVNGKVIFYDEIEADEAVEAGAHISVGKHTEDGYEVTDPTGNPRSVYVVAGEPRDEGDGYVNDDLRWARAEQYGEETAGMILEKRGEPVLELDYLEGGTLTVNNGAFSFRNAIGAVTQPEEAKFEDFNDLSNFLRNFDSDIVAVLTVNGDLRDGGNLNISWDREDEQQNRETYGITTLYVVNGMADNPETTDEIEAPTIDTSYGNEGMTVFCDRPDVAVYLDDQVKWVNRRFDLRGAGDILFLGSEELTGATVADGFMGWMDVYVPRGTIRLGDPHITSQEVIMLNDSRLDASRIFVHGGNWLVAETLVRAGELINGESPIPGMNTQDSPRFLSMETCAGTKDMADGGAGMLQIVKYKDASSNGKTSTISGLVSDRVNVIRNVQPEWVWEEGEIEGFYFNTLKRDDQDEFILNDEYTYDEAPEARIVVGTGAELDTVHGIYGQPKFIQVPHYDEYYNEGEGAYIKWNGDHTTDPHESSDVEMLDTDEESPVYAKPVLWSDGVVEMDGADLYGLALGADSRTNVMTNLHMSTETVDTFEDPDGKTVNVMRPESGSYAWLEGGAALLTQANGSIEFNEPGYLNTGDVRAFVPVSDEENWYHALHVRGGEPKVASYEAQAAALISVLALYLPTLSNPAIGGFALQVGMYEPDEELLDGWVDPTNVPVAFDENGALYYVYQTKEPVPVTLAEIKRDWTILDTDEEWSAERQKRIQLLKEQTTSSGTQILPVAGLTPRFNWWDGTDENGERVGTPNGTLRFGYPFEVYRRISNVVYDEFGNPDRIEDGFGDYEEGSYLRGFNTWQEAEAYLDSTSDGTAAAKALFELKKTDFGTYEDDQQQTQNILHDDGTIGVPSLEDNGNGFEVAWTDRLPVYVVLVGDGVTLGQNPAMPKQTEELILEGSSCGNTVSFTGTMTLATETMFHGITMDARAATIHVNDQELMLNWTTGRIGTLKGKKAYETDSSGRYAADGRVSILAPADDEYGLNWIRYMNETHQSVDLYITTGVQTLGTLAVDVQGVARGENDPMPYPAYPVFVNADPANSSQWNTSWKPVTVGNMIFYSGKFASGAMTVECALDAGDENVSAMEPSLTVVTGKLTVNGSARIVGNRQVHTSSGDIYIKEFLDMDTQGGIFSAGSLTVDGTVLLGGSYCDVDTDRSATVRADNDITIGDRLISGSKGNQIVYGGKFTVKDVKVLNPWDDPDDDTDPEMKWTLTPNEEDETETSYKAKDGEPEEDDQEAPENAILLVAKKLEKNGVYCYADEDGALAIVTGSVGLYEMNDADDWVTNRLLDDGIAAQALLFADYNNPGYGQSSTYWLTKKKGTGIYVKKSLRVNVLLKQEGSNAGEEYDTLQEALDAIDAKKDKTAVYTVTIDRKAAAKDNNKVTPATITGAGTAAEKTTYAAIKLPTNLAGLTVCATASEDPDVYPAVLYTGGDLKAASSLTLDNVQFMRWDNTKGQYATVTAAEPNGKPVTTKVSIASGTLTIAHTVAFDTPVLFDGGGKAAFELAPKDSELYAGMNYRLTGDTYLDEDGQPVVVLDEFGDPVLAEDENGDPIPVLDENGEPVLDENDDPVYEYVYQTEAAQTVKTALAKRDQLNYGTDQIISTRALVDGGFQGFANVTLPRDSTIILSGESAGKSPVFNNIGSFVADKPFFYMIDPVAKPGTAKITNLTMDGGLFVTEGALSVTTLSLGKKAEVAAFGDFKVTGDVINRADSSWSENYATLTTVQKIKATATASTGGSQLTVAGEVVNPDDSLPIRVKLLAGEGSDPQFAQYSPVMLSQQIWPGAECFSKLLTAPKATAEAFAPHPDNVKWNGNSLVTAFKINSANHTNEYLVRKEKNDIYVESGSVVEVALAEGIVNEDNSVDDATAIAGASYIGAYKTWKEAVAAVDAIKDPAAEYTLVLVKDINKAGGIYAPAAITMPAQAAKVKVMSADADTEAGGVQPHVLCFSGNLTLKQDTIFRNVKFAFRTNATTDNKNAALAAGKYALTLDNFSFEGCVPASITGAKGGSLTVTGAPVTVLKNVSGFTETRLESSLIASTGTFTSDMLTLVGDATLGAGGAVTVTDVYTEDGGNNLHGIYFTKSSKGAGKSNLTIRGKVLPQSKENPLILNLMKATEQEELTEEEFTDLLALKLDGKNEDKVLVDAAAQIAEIGLTPTQAVRVKIGNKEYRSDENAAEVNSASYMPVKANKNLYLAPIPAKPENNTVRPEMNETQAKLLPALTLLQMLPDAQTGTITSVYLDLSQAMAEIDALGNRSWEYQAAPGMLAGYMYPGMIGADGVLQVSDTNVTDANKYSPLSLPKKDKADTLWIGNILPFRIGLYFTGKLSGSGDVTFKNIVFHSCKGAKDDTVSTFDIAMAQNSQLADGFWPVSALKFDGGTGYDLVPGGMIGKITGVKAVAGKNQATKIRLYYSNVTLATGFAGTPDVEIINSSVLTRGANDIGTLSLGNLQGKYAVLTSYGNLKLADVNVGQVRDNSKAWIAAKEDTKDNSTISITGNVTTQNGKYLAVRIINRDKKADTKGNELFVSDIADYDKCGYYTAEADYAGRRLVLAPAADASVIRAYPYLDGKDSEDKSIVSYKTADKYVVNGRKDDMKIRVISKENDSSVADTYAKTFYEAVQIIENANQPDLTYEIVLLGDGDETYDTGKPDNRGDATIGAITLPTKAKEVRITNKNPEGDPNILRFTGAFTAKCPVSLDTVKLEGGSIRGGVFSGDRFVLDAGSKSISIEYYDGPYTLSVSGIKGESVLFLGSSEENHLTVDNTGTTAVKALVLEEYVTLKSEGAVTATTLVQKGDSEVTGTGDVKVTDYTAYSSSSLTAEGDITVSGTLKVNDQSGYGMKIECRNAAKKITLGRILGSNSEMDSLYITWRLTEPAFNNTGALTKTPVSNLKITGECSGIERFGLQPMVRQPEVAAAESIDGQQHDAGWYLLADRDGTWTDKDGEPGVKDPDKQARIDDYNYGFTVQDAKDLVAAKRIADMPKVSDSILQLALGDTPYQTGDSSGISVVPGQQSGQCLLKHGGNLFLTTLAPVVAVTVVGTDENGGFDYNALRFSGTFFTLEEAAKAVDQIGGKNGTAYTDGVLYTLLSDVGVQKDAQSGTCSFPEGTVPAAKLALPKAARRLVIIGDGHAIATTGGALAPACNTEMSGVTLVNAKKNGTDYAVSDKKINVTLGAWSLSLDDDVSFGPGMDKITGTGALTLGDLDLEAGSVSAGSLTLRNCATLTVTGNVAVKDLTLGADATLTAGGDITSTNLLTVEDESKIRAGGKFTMKDVLLVLDMDPEEDQKTCWDAKLATGAGSNPDAFQITVNGTVTMDDPREYPGVTAGDSVAPIRIGKWTVGDQGIESDPVAEGTVLATAPKAADGWFRPTAVTNGDGETEYEEGIFVCKSGKNIVYDPYAVSYVYDPVNDTNVRCFPVSLICRNNYVNADGSIYGIDDGNYVVPTVRSDFLTLPEALREIDNLAVTMQPVRDQGIPVVLDKGVKPPYEEYAVVLNAEELHVTNAQGAYAALALPSKTNGLDIVGRHSGPHRVFFSGGVALKSNLTLTTGVELVSMKSVTGNKGKKDVPAPADYTLGNYHLTFSGAAWETGFYDAGDDGSCEIIGKVTATAGKGGLILKNGSDNLDQIDRQLRVRIAGTLNSDVELGPDTMLTVGGAATVGTLTFDATDGGQIAPVFAADKALTLGAVVQHADMTKSQVNRAAGKIWKKDLSTPITVKGTKVNGETVSVIRDSQGADLAPCVKLYLGTAASVPAGTKAATGSGLSAADWDLYAGDLDVSSFYDSYIGYVYKNALYVGAQNKPT